MNVTAADTIRRFRTNAGLSQEQLAERAQVSSRTVRALESGQAKRPHRDTLLAVAHALGLSGDDAELFHEIWRTGSRDLADYFHADPPPDVLRFELQEQRRRTRDMVIRNVVEIRADRSWSRYTIERTFEALDDGLRTWSWMLGYSDGLTAEDLLPVDCVNIEPVAVVDIPGNVRIFHGSLRRPLARGEAYSLSFGYDYDSAQGRDRRLGADCEALYSAYSVLPAMLFEVRFDPGALPRRAWQVRQATFDGPPEAGPELPLSPFGVAALAELPAAPGVHGIRWEWE